MVATIYDMAKSYTIKCPPFRGQQQVRRVAIWKDEWFFPRPTELRKEGGSAPTDNWSESSGQGCWVLESRGSGRQTSPRLVVLQEAMAFGLVGACPRVWRSREDAARLHPKQASIATAETCPSRRS